MYSKAFRQGSRAVVASLFFLTVFAVAGLAQGNNTVSGFVFGPERAPVSNVAVELSDEFNRLVGRTLTNGSGRYAFFRLKLGRYYIAVRTLGFGLEEQTAEVEITSFKVIGNETVQQDFYLRAKKENTGGVPSVTGTVFAQDIPKDAQRSYDKAVSDLKNKKIDEGIVGLKAALSIFPDYYLALEKLGEVYIDRQEYEEARLVSAKAAAINARSYESLYALSYSQFQLKRYSEALESAKKALELNPNSVNALFLQGVSLRYVGDYENAVASLNRAKKLATPPAPEIFWQLSLIYTNNLKKYSAAAEELEHFLKAKPNYEEADKVRELIKKLRAKAKA